jgi:cholesterol oxidase
VTAVRPREGGGYQVQTRDTRSKRKPGRAITTSKVVLAAGTWGTQNLLHAMRDEQLLPDMSPMLGVLTRTNSEALLGAARRTVDERTNFSRGVAITSSIHPNDTTHIEPVRYGKGSNAMGLMQTVATTGGTRANRLWQAAKFVVRHPVRTVGVLSTYRWSERVVILLVMQSLDNSITTYTRRGLFGRRRYTSKQGHGEPNPTFIQAGYDATQLAAKHMNGTAGGTWGELANIPMTAHFIGGCAIGVDAEHGVIDPYHRMFHYPDISIVDGSAISANLGVNPSLTITAQAERAFSFWPNKGEPDTRPEPGAAYAKITPVFPVKPIVPETAPAALRLPIG